MARETLQEQLRRRSEELAARQRSLAEQGRKQEELIAALVTYALGKLVGAGLGA